MKTKFTHTNTRMHTCTRTRMYARRKAGGWVGGLADAGTQACTNEHACKHARAHAAHKISCLALAWLGRTGLLDWPLSSQLWFEVLAVRTHATHTTNATHTRTARVMCTCVQAYVYICICVCAHQHKCVSSQVHMHASVYRLHLSHRRVIRPSQSR